MFKNFIKLFKSWQKMVINKPKTKAYVVGKNVINVFEKLDDFKYSQVVGTYKTTPVIYSSDVKDGEVIVLHKGKCDFDGNPIAVDWDKFN